jgi:hypothetical protein
LALLFLLSGQISRFSVPRSMLESGKAIDRSAVEKATLINQYAVPHPPEINISANDQRVDSSADAAISKISEKLSGVQSHPKNLMRRRFKEKSVFRSRPTANLVTRFHSWLVGELGLAHPTNGRSIKKRLAARHVAAAGFKAHEQN